MLWERGSSPKIALNVTGGGSQNITGKKMNGRAGSLRKVFRGSQRMSKVPKMERRHRKNRRWASFSVFFYGLCKSLSSLHHVFGFHSEANELLNDTLWPGD